MSKRKTFSFSLSITIECDATEANELSARSMNDEVAQIAKRFTGHKVTATSFGTCSAPSTVNVTDLVYLMQDRGERIARLEDELKRLKAKPKKP